eukprot:TRINITY_DN31287_c0_g1_i1.p1 TRINITY_DN31287_c0_g1~~TRINITY_DN31287_c0_g1_i1.p1  ORF type:complete len:126 (+),score=13.83 TRINITY_DN31287_c0_g1_i1:137-514(+)
MEEKLEGPLEVQPAGSLLFKKKPVTKFFTYEQGYFTCYTTRRDWQLGNPELTLDLARDVQSVEHKAGGRAFAVDCVSSGNFLLWRKISTFMSLGAVSFVLINLQSYCTSHRPWCVPRCRLTPAMQ